jgi:hypothetical protein
MLNSLKIKDLPRDFIPRSRQTSSLFLVMRSYRLKQNSNMAGAAELAQLMTDRASDFQHLERIKGQLSMMALGIGKASDAVGNGLVDSFACGNDLHDVLMDMVIRHGISSSPTAGGEVVPNIFGSALT